MTNDQINEALANLRTLLAAHEASPTEANSVACIGAILKIAHGMQSNIKSTLKRRTQLSQAKRRFII